MVKVFDTISDFEAYVLGGMIAGDLYYVKEDESVHFRTNNIDGSDKNYGVGVGDDLVPTGNIALTENGTNIDVAEYATASVNVPIPDGYIVPTGNLEISANGTNIDVSAYATVSVDVAGESEPELVWETLVGNNLEMNIGTTYIFKTNVAGVYMWHLGLDTSGDGIIDNIEDVSQSPLGKMVAGTEYYFTALNEYAGYDDNTHSYMIFAGSSFNIETALPAGAVIQYAVKPEPSEDSDSEDDSPVEPSNDSPVVGE